MALGVVALDWITADEEYGRNGEFLDELETLGHRYVVEVPVNTTVWTEDPAGVRPALRRSGPSADAAEPRVGAERWPRWPSALPPESVAGLGGP